MYEAEALTTASKRFTSCLKNLLNHRKAYSFSMMTSPASPPKAARSIMDSTSVLAEDGASSRMSLSFSLRVLLCGNEVVCVSIGSDIVPMGLEAVFLLEGELVPMGLEAVFLLEESSVVPMGLEAVFLLEGELNSIALVAFVEVVVEAAVNGVESIEWDRESLYEHCETSAMICTHTDSKWSGKR